MSDRLAISVAFSVLMMTGYVLFSTDAVHLPMGSGLSAPVSISVPALPSASRLLPIFR